MKLISSILLSIAASLLPIAASADTLSQVPLTVSENPPSNLLLSLSIEFPTVGAAYNGSSYSSSTEYVGNWNSKVCYAYDTTAGNQYFVENGLTDNSYNCGGTGWSGNFLNWSATSSIDIIRLALTGGWRVLDETGATGRTVVSRAFLYESFYASGSNFPRLKIGKSVALQVMRTADLAGGAFPSGASNVYVVNCRDRFYVGTASSGGNCDTPGTSANVFNGFARVLACGANERAKGRPSLYSDPGQLTLCKQYPSGAYKPIGVMQAKADRLRYGVMAYLMDNDPAHNGGALRSPLRDGRDEWDSSTGVYVKNPLSASEGNSGTMNFINKFGLSNPNIDAYTTPATWLSTQRGSYKTYDVMGELYYEAIRYLRGQQPTPDAIAGLGNATTAASLKSGFPAYTVWTDPVTGSCQRHSILNISDENTWCDKNIPGNTMVDSNCGDNVVPVGANDFDAFYWTHQLGTNIRALTASRPGGALSNRTALETEVTGLGSAYVSGGLAYWAATQDVRSDLGGTQHIATLSFDVNEPAGEITERKLFLMGLAGGLVNNGGTFSTGFQPNGYPNNYFLASNAVTLFNNLLSAVTQSINSSGTASVTAVSSARVYNGSLAYQPLSKTGSWAGTVRAFYQTNVTDANGATHLAGEQKWSAGSLLTSETGRQIITYNNGGVPFQWSSLSTAQQTSLNTNSTGNNDSLGSSRLAWLRGSVANEGTGATKFRVRNDADLGTTKIGDIFNSTPYFAGVPSAPYEDAGYVAFARNYANRKPIIYVGANDGMLHGFDGDSGREVLAYIPSLMFSNHRLSNLTGQDYSHAYYVDGSPMVGDAYLNGSWRSVLVSGLGAGGRGIFALNVTNPGTRGSTIPAGNFSESNASQLPMWEFSSANDSDLGYILGIPTLTSETKRPEQILRLKVNGQSRWAAIFGNGYASDGGKPVLFIFFLDSNGTWQLGTNYLKITAANSGTEASNNGLSTPVPVDYDLDGFADVIYAGDLRGNLWRFNISASSGVAGVTDNPNTWTVGTGTSNQPLFTATDDDGARQAITGAPIAVPNTAALEGWVVAFGTGRLFTSPDQISTQQQAIYGIWDTNSGPVNVSQLSRPSFTTSTLSGSGLVNGRTLRVLGVNTFCYSATQKNCGPLSTLKKGYRLALPQSGERVIGNSENAAQYLITTSVIPPPPVLSNCDQGGDSWLNAIDILFGGNTKGLFPSTSNTNEASVQIGDISVSAALQRNQDGTIGILIGTADGVKKEANVSSSLLRGRQTWREFLRP